MKRTILRLKTRSFELATHGGEELVVVRTDLGLHRFQTVGSDAELLRAYGSGPDVLELVVLVDRDATGSIVGGELLEVVGPVSSEVAESGVVLRRELVEENVDDVDCAFDRIRKG